MSYGLPDQSFSQLLHLFQQEPKIDEVILFGSRAMSRYHNGSDIDLALKGSFTHTDIALLYVATDELFLPYTFDIVDYHSISSEPVLEHIDRVGIVIFSRK